ncbi:peptide chain release factor 3 [Oenococcus sicerae]|uniref:Peptide chain release factor 3 n=1 Tax=Oenococcus sicerae TaxID=2203724 RepID=A0ABX5QK44_9LACO|nr:peptide chain release factor 3 [Oenococcus sicerae]QAS69130.1 peptide chain release factor 3 [Oenococcus sicerae]
MTNFKDEYKNRITFAIISHPDAGKTTLTEQLLLHGGVIRQAGTVKGRGSNKMASSDWMAIEQQRGISVTSSVLQFDYAGKRINILDTPGHEDFSEDTYRTLMAVDSAVMVIDSAKGIEPQTKKLFEIVSKRHIPVFTFFNKLDRDGRDAFDLVDELEKTLGIQACPMNWPIGSGQVLQGIYDLQHDKLIRYNSTKTIDQSVYDESMEEIVLQKDAGNQFDESKILHGQQTPVFFGSALANFGVEEFLSEYLKYAPAPSYKRTVDHLEIQPDNEQFTAFVFKIQANMNPNHRDRIAFVRIVSGEFHKGMEVTLARNAKKLKLSNVTQFMADERENIETAVPGDIIGLYDTGNFQIGDSIYEGKQTVEFEPLPTFTPELFNRVIAKDVMKQKSYHKGINQLVQEGTIQLFESWHGQEYILGAVGQLQFEVFQFRMANEYNSQIIFETLGKKIARWIRLDELDERMNTSRSMLAKDRLGNPVILFENRFALTWFADKYPNVKLESKM